MTNLEMTAPRRLHSSDRREPPGTLVSIGFAGDDAALVEALRERQPVAMAAFFERYAPYVERVITHVMGYDRELADIVQEVFLRALGSIDRLRNARALPLWLSRVATTTARKVLRSRSRRRWLRLFLDSDDEDRWERPSAPSDENALRAVRAVYAVLDLLSTEERIAFSLRYIEGMELVEVAHAAGTSLSTVKRRLRRAERSFAAEARRRPELAEWLEEGTRWSKA